MQPLITIMLPVYNGKPYLRASVESVLNQIETNFEFLILDDNSTDGSREYLESIQDSRLTLYKNNINKGLFYNLNFLIQKSTTQLLKLWAQDDIMYNNCLSTFIDFHKQHQGIGFSYSGRTIIDEKGNTSPIKTFDNTPTVISQELHARIAFYTGSIAGNISNVCINKIALNEVGLFKENMKISADFDMWVRIAEKYETGFIKEPLIYLRDHDKQLSRVAGLYINHVKEDMIIYRNLLGYVSPEIAKEGRALLRNHKFVFYYTLMVKELLKGNFKNTTLFYKELSKMDNIFMLSIVFIKAKLFKPTKPALLHITSQRL